MIVTFVVEMVYVYDQLVSVIGTITVEMDLMKLTVVSIIMVSDLKSASVFNINVEPYLTYCTFGCTYIKVYITLKMTTNLSNF